VPAQSRPEVGVVTVPATPVPDDIAPADLSPRLLASATRLCLGYHGLAQLKSRWEYTARRLSSTLAAAKIMTAGSG
jgi:hypothetical protein